MTEQELVQKAKDGDEDAFAALMTQNEKRIYSLAWRLTGSPEDAADLTQEAFLNAWRGLAKFQGDSAFSTWLYRLASNACVDFLRREKRKRSMSMTVSQDDELEGRQAQLPDDGPTPEEHLQQKELRRAIAAGLETLSPEHRTVLVMREMSGLSYLEIAETLQLEEGTVKSRIARARLALRQTLQQGGNFSERGPSKK